MWCRARCRTLLRLGSVSIAELFEARQWIQGASVRAACERLTDAQIDALEQNVNESEIAHAEGRFAGSNCINVDHSPEGRPMLLAPSS